MRVVLFCGGLGMRMRSQDNDPIPKPMQLVGPRPLLWHVMKYYSYFGHRDFVLCLGYGADQIKDYFLNYDETLSNDFTMRDGDLEMHSTDISDWTISFVDTGVKADLSDRLLSVRDIVEDDEHFLVNYADVLTDAELPKSIEATIASGAAASMMAVPPATSFHSVTMDADGLVDSISAIAASSLWVNGGHFVFTPEIFGYLTPGGNMVMDGLRGLAADRRLLALPHHGFWRPADTVKDRAELDRDWEQGTAPWAVWERHVG